MELPTKIIKNYIPQIQPVLDFIVYQLLMTLNKEDFKLFMKHTNLKL